MGDPVGSSMGFHRLVETRGVDGSSPSTLMYNSIERELEKSFGSIV